MTVRDVPSMSYISSFWPEFSTFTDPGATRTCASHKTAPKAVPQPPSSAGSTNPGSSSMCFDDLDISLFDLC
jgi:hypothetical protein